MDISNVNVALLGKRISASKARILTFFPFYGVLIMDTKFLLDEKEKSVSTDGKGIYFNPYFLNSLNDEELDISILHQIFHIILKHPFRCTKGMHADLYHRAADIVVNSNIMKSNDRTEPLYIKGRELPYLAPNNKAGHLFTTEEVYEMLCKEKKVNPNFSKDDQSNQEADAISQSGGLGPDTLEEILGPKRIDQAFNYVPEVTGVIYFRTESYGTIDSEQKIYTTDEYVCPDYSINPLLFTSDKLKKIAQIRHVKARIVSKDLNYLSYPSYVINFKPTFYDMETVIETKENEFEYYDIGTTQEVIDTLYNTPFSNKQLAADEKAYRKFVYKNYTFATPLHKTFFAKFAKDRNISGAPKDIIISCRNAIAQAAKYDLNFDEPANGKDKVLYFLCESKKGICRHFALALAVFYRALGIPSRLVTGYIVNGHAGVENFAFAQDGHAWVEVYLDGTGWIRIDPTPISSNEQTTLQPKEGEKQKDKGKGLEGDDFDTHERWDDAKKMMDDLTDEEINSRILKAYEVQESHGNGCGKLPGFIESLIQDLRKPQVDWRTILNEFVQEDVYDYSFMYPDKRFQDSPFIMPSYSDKDFVIKNVLFMVDCSGSMSTKDITDCYSEIKGALEQFEGKLEGYMGFFDTIVYPIHKINSETDITKIKPVGRGGTDFEAVFKYVDRKMKDNPPSSIIILSDGYAPIPRESMANGIPVLWIFTQKESTAPWGKVTHIK